MNTAPIGRLATLGLAIAPCFAAQGDSIAGEGVRATGLPSADAPGPLVPVTPGPARPRPPLSHPYRLNGYGEIADVGSWQLWWEFHRDPYLRLGAIGTRKAPSVDDDFFLGAGQARASVRGGRATQAQVRDSILPALYLAIADGGQGQFVPRAMLSIAKCSRAEGSARAASLMQSFLKLSRPDLDRVAALSLGILESEESYPLLRGLAFDDARGRTLNGGVRVSDEVRAFAALGLGLHGRASRDPKRRTAVVADLVELIDEGELPEGGRAAAVLALGLVPLRIAPGEEICADGAISAPSASLQSELSYLAGRFADEQASAQLRGNAATSLARLLESQTEADIAPMKDVVTSLFIGALDRRSGAPSALRSSCVLALGLLGDADDDLADRWIRWALDRSVAGSYLERRFALVSLGLVGSRRGSAGAPFAGTEEARNDLVHHLSKGRKSMRPWAAISLGIMAHRLREADGPPSTAARVAVRNAVRSAKLASDLGAYAIAAGLLRDAEAAPALVRKMDRVRDVDAQGYCAVGLGLIGDRRAIEPLLERLADEDRAGPLATHIGLALGLLGHTGIAEELVERMASAETDAERIPYARALGALGDAMAIEALTARLAETERSSELRETIAVSLGWIGDRRALPWRTAFLPGTNYAAAPAALTSADRAGALDVP